MEQETLISNKIKNTEKTQQSNNTYTGDECFVIIKNLIHDIQIQQKGNSHEKHFCD